jgi:hypothetical protein
MVGGVLSTNFTLIRPDLVDDNEWEKSVIMVSTDGVGRESRSASLHITCPYVS